MVEKEVCFWEGSLFLMQEEVDLGDFLIDLFLRNLVWEGMI